MIQTKGRPRAGLFVCGSPASGGAAVGDILRRYNAGSRLPPPQPATRTGAAPASNEYSPQITEAAAAHAPLRRIEIPERALRRLFAAHARYSRFPCIVVSRIHNLQDFYVETQDRHATLL
ncbi:hypothetical protein [Bradyrhizobium acaciae]|uniref:hypothetical protein n=1 Tax=Bradyrhizobium acaciae TaxID=2683706 RepID=UPI001E351E3E|nr:hypothetical protein [Bradyrhizobium acaciae]MCC8981236.1 hypothetical protein [Bradyrhizobium acaciae]